MAGRVAELKTLIENDVPDSLATGIAHIYQMWQSHKSGKMSDWEETRQFLFATDTRSTSTGLLPHKNSTTLPKLTQIRDNLHANYMAALFPNDEWLKWEGYSEEDDTAEKRKSIQAYMSNKLRQSGFRNVVSKLVYDYIDYGNCFGDTYYTKESSENIDGEEIVAYEGPRAYRVSPYDIVFNPAAMDFDHSPKIVKSIKTLNELRAEAMEQPDMKYDLSVIERAANIRSKSSAYDAADFNKAMAYSIDGFGSLHEYYQSGYVEILEFQGDIADENGTFLRNYMITVIDRRYVVRKVPNPSWTGKDTMVHGGWRSRPDNLWAMGPLDNLVGIQYRIDHLENLKADAMDKAVDPVKLIKGNVDEFEDAPGEYAFGDPDSDVVELGKNLNGVIAADNNIQMLMQTMEEMAGAPKQAMGIRTPGEKTAYEVQQLENASSRIFQQKATDFEINVLEPLLNNMLAEARRNLSGVDVARVMDDDLGVEGFLKISKEDLSAKGKLRPIGARHFAARAQLLQNLNGVYSSPVGQMIAPHTSSIGLAGLVEDSLGLARYQIYKPNVAVFEQMETQKLMNQAQEDIEAQAMTPIEDEGIG